MSADENSPLIVPEDHGTDLGTDHDIGKPTTYANELRYIVINSIPNCISFLLQYCINAFSVFFVSRLGTNELAATSLAVTTYFISGPVLFMGMATAIDTLCSQAYGAKSYHLVGLYFQKNVAVSFVILVPLVFLWFNMDKLFALYIHDPEIVRLATLYFYVAVLEAPAFILYENGKRFVQAQGIFHATTYILAIVVPVNLALNYLLIVNDTVGVGFIGAPIAAVSSYWLLTILLFLYVRYIDGIKCWCPIDFRVIFSNLKSLIKLNVYGVLMVLSECLAFQLITIMAALFGVVQLAAQSVTFTLSNFFYQLPFAIGVVASTRIGNYVGSRNKQAAIIATRVSYLITIGLGFTNFLIAINARQLLASYFSNNDAQLKKVIADSLIVVGIYQLLDCGFNVCSAAVLRAQGRQRIGGILSVFSYYVIGLAAEWLLGFYYNYKLCGLWAGMSIGLGFLSLTQTFYVIYSDWNHILESAKQNY